MPNPNQAGAYFSGGTPAASVDTVAYAPGLLGQEVVLNVGTPAAPVFVTYKYVKAGGTIAANAVCLWNGVTTQVGNEVISSATATSARFAGVATAAATINQFLWIQVGGGPVTAAATAATAANVPLKSNATGGFAVAAAVTDPVFANSLTAESGGVLTCMLIRGSY